MDVLARREGALQIGVVRHVRHDAQFDLRVVGRQQHALLGDERFAHPAPGLGAHRDVLQIGIGRGQPAGDHRRLRIVRVHAAGVRVDHARQLVGVGGLQLGQPAVLQQHLRQRVVLRQLAQHFLVRRRRAAGGLAYHRQLHAAEQDLPQLLGRIQVEGLSSQLIGLLLEQQHFLAQLVALASQLGGIDLDAVAFDRGQHRRHLHLQQIDALQSGIGRHLRAQHLVQLQREIGVLGGVMAGLVHRHLIEADLLGALAAQVALRQVVQADAAMRLQHIRLQHGVFGDTGQTDAFVGEHVRVVLGMVQQFRARGVLQP